MMTVPDVIALLHTTAKFWQDDEIAALRERDPARAHDCKLLAAQARHLADEITERQAAA
jgi:hypothetical protein